ncbi:uncharacterized protein ccdc14 [Sphaeramia orbicularis]|uniref:uncharacterized protein ccdc14 n=1 Tax=Sphaeramia orbicularis TaxID=375764 RepID=UPI00117D7E6E|nr:uncharacterized protein LOC115432371 [Sphaeramia orbicularis]
MKGTVKRKVLTSGRLSGGVKVQPVRRKGTDDPGAAGRPELSYSLYSTDSEDQVITLHKGLDRCAALLNGILEAEAVDRPQTVKDGSAKPRSTSSVGKKTTKKQIPKKDQKPHSGPGRPRPRPGPHQSSPAPHTGVKLHLSKKQRHDLQLSKSQISEPRPPPTSPTSLPQAPPTPQGAVGPSDRHQDECGRPTELCETAHGGGQVDAVETDRKLETVQRLMDELRALIGRDSIVETLLDHLELAVSASNHELQLHNHDKQTHRNAMLLREQLKTMDLDKEQRTQNLQESNVTVLRDELAAARCELHRLRDDVTELRKDLKDTQNRLTDRETDNRLLRTELDRTRKHLQDSVHHQSQLSMLVQQRQEEVEKLQRVLHLHQWGPTGPPQDRIHQYLMSLGQQDPAHPEEEVGVATETDGQKAEDKRTDSASLRRSSRPDHVDQSHGEKRRSVSECDVESVTYDWSVRSESTFDTRAETAFRDGLAALDASIASLQKTIQMDLVR